MSAKSFIQILILFLIILIVSSVYYKYFNVKKNVVEEINLTDVNLKTEIADLEKKISDLELENSKLNNKIENSNVKLTEIQSNNSNNEKNNKSTQKIDQNKNKLKKNYSETKKKEIKNLVKNIEYTSIDEKGNKFYLLANSGKSNDTNKDILDLEEVKGKISSEIRDTIYIVSDFAQYNSLNLNSKFYKNVIINYQDKEITCVNFDINMETNKAIAYNNVIITDPKSEMKAGIVEFDLKTKNIEINPESAITDIKVTSN